MIIRSKTDLTENDVTPRSAYLNRRSVMALGAGSVVAGGLGLTLAGQGTAAANTSALQPLEAAPWPASTDEALTDYDAATGYNNFYEFGTGKSDPASNAHTLRTRPWTIEVDGLVAKPGVIGIEEMLAFPLEERIYRLRCVEAWSMVIPWIGFELNRLLARFEPLGSAKYVAFETLLDPEQMPGQRRPALPWPYVEGLRLDEAMHPLTLMTVGMYGTVLPNQNGAPVRLVVPWKYGFKSIKSVVKITLTETEPPATWNILQPSEYGFYSNVNPNRDHPRWSQKTERRIGDFFRIDTLMFNGYEEQVAHLYQGMNLVDTFY